MLTPAIKAIAFVLMLALTFITMFLTGRGLDRQDPRKTMSSFEFAGTHDRARGLIDSWPPGYREVMRRSLRWDFAFIACYAITLAWASAWAVRTVGRATGLLAAAAFVAVFAAGPIVAGLLDVIENFALLLVLDGATGDLLPRTAKIAAAVKFSLCGVALLVVAFGAVVWFHARVLHRLT